MSSSQHDTRRCARIPGTVILGVVSALAATSCGNPPKHQGPGDPGVSHSQDTAEVPSILEQTARQKKLAGMNPAQPLPPSDAQKRLGTALDQYFQRAATQRYYVHVDKPLYQPGESIWFRVWELATPTLAKGPDGHGILAQLVSPKGATVLEKRVRVQVGVATNDFVLPASVQGGEYTLRMTSDRGGSVERKVIVSTYQPPRIKKKVKFLRKAYGPGDQVSAAMSLARATGEPLADKQATAIVTIDESEVARVPVKTNAKGNGVVRFSLPAKIARGDGLLTVLIEDGGVTESIQRRIPILLKELQVQLFPEGGDLVQELPGRVYFQAKNLIGKPADIEGRVVDDTGAVVARYRSFHNGMGRFELIPRTGRSYFLEVSKPVGIKQRVPLPAAQEAGCTMTAVDDPKSRGNDLRMAVACSQARTVIVTASLLEKRLGDIAVEVAQGQPSVVALPVPIGSQGAIRVTAMNDQLQPLAERLVYRGLGADLNVQIKPDRESYAPRDQVELAIQTRDLAGKPVAADLALAVVDDTVLSLADDKTAHLLTRMYLESEMPGQEIEEPNFYFSDDKKAPQALDLVLGTQGWRRFEWQQVLAPPPDTTATKDGLLVATGMAQPRPQAPPANMRRDAPRKPMQRAANKAKKKPMKKVAKMEKQKAGGKKRRARRRPARKVAEKRPMFDRVADKEANDAGDIAGADMDWGEALLEEREVRNRWAWAPVRVFPVPNYSARYDGPRVDFREVVFWQPSVKTDQTGVAKVRFYLSDAVTSFRATAEGVSTGGLPGRGHTLVTSKLPVSLAVKMPLEVSAGDRIKLPVTVANETSRPYDVAISTQFGAAFRVQGGIPAQVSLRGGERKSFFATLQVVGNGADPEHGKALVAIDTSNLRDEVSRAIKVVPLGFPQEISLAGTLDDTRSHKVSLTGALPGTIEATLNVYPSPLATMVKGTEAIIREPSGCFEQASSANYPNIMVLGYLEQNDAAEPELVERTMGMLDRGYKKLTGYESPKKGYEWFGGDPGHEALTAYGLMEFADMKQVYGDVDQGMIDRTANWLKKRRDGKGGFKRNKRALDSFGRASAEVTNGYIAYALSEAGQGGLAQELAYQKQVAKNTKDPYLLALATNVLLQQEPKAAGSASALAKLEGMQANDGSFPGADHSITRSGGVALTIETTALATLAMVKAGRASTPGARNAIGWLNQNRSGYGRFGSTQSTILALKAMTSYADAARVTRSGGSLSILVNGRKVGTLDYEKGHRGALTFDDLASVLQPGGNVIELQTTSKEALPYSIAISYRSKMPASSEQTQVAVATKLTKAKVPMGESVRMKVSVKNLADKGIPMTLARVGLPGGLAFQTWQLKELKDKGLIDFYETRAREVVLYFRSMAPGAEKAIDLDLLARVPGEYVGPASRAYLYYTDEFKHWAEPVRVTVE